MLLGLSPAPAAAWQQGLTGFPGKCIGVNTAGDVFAAASASIAYGLPEWRVARFSGSDGTLLWVSDSGYFGAFNFGEPFDLAVDGAGDVIVVGTTFQDSFTVSKYAGASGTQLWSMIFPGTQGLNRAHAVAVDSVGDVVAAGVRGTYDFTVVKLSGVSGAELWQQRIDVGFSDIAYDVGVDSAGDVVAVGHLEIDDWEYAEADFAVIKFDGATGVELWRSTFGGTHEAKAYTVAIDASGDVIAGGFLHVDGTGYSFLVAKFAASTGSELWRTVISGPASPFSEDSALDVALDGNGDVIASGSLDNVSSYSDFMVAKLSGTSGAEVWRQEIDGNASLTDKGKSVAVDGAGDVFAGGSLSNGNGTDMAIIKFAGDSGTELWRRVMDGSSTGSDDVLGELAVDNDGNVVATGGPDFPTTYRFLTMKLNGTDGSVGSLSGDKLRLRDRLGIPTRRRFLAMSKDPNLTTPALGSLHDPTTQGAKLRLVGPGDDATFTLPAGPQWTALGNPPGSKGYKYSDRQGVNGPCRLLRVRPEKLLKAVCVGSLGTIPFSLDEPAQGEVTLSFQFGADEPQCIAFGGTVLRDTGTSNPGPFGAFIANDASPAEVSCPAP